MTATERNEWRDCLPKITTKCIQLLSVRYKVHLDNTLITLAVLSLLYATDKN